MNAMVFRSSMWTQRRRQREGTALGISGSLRRWLRAMGAGTSRAGIVLALVGSLTFTGCATHYVSGNTPERPSGGFVKPAQPHPVQVAFEFRTRGVANGRGTELLRESAIQQVHDSGLFSRIDLEPSPKGGLLAISLDNVVDPDESPVMKGVITGATLLLVKNFVTDHYVCTARYVGPGGSPPLEHTVRHALHSSVGAVGGSPPPGAVQAANARQAIETILKQALSQVLDALSRDPNFK